MDQPVKTHLIYSLLVLLLLFAACWNWFNTQAAWMVGRQDVREASYLASEFTSFCLTNDRLPNADEAAGFSSRLAFVEVRDAHYTYRFGRHGRDRLILNRDANQRFQFTVH